MVSVIIPNYNHAPFLKERIDSVLSQTYQDYEIIILDDCSTDNSRELIEGYRENQKVSNIIYNEVNGGSPFSQWKKGMEIAKGEFIWIAESDDFCDAELLETAVKAFAEDKDCVLWFCASDMADIKGELHGLHPNQKGMSSCVLDGVRFAKKHMSRCNALVNASSAVFRKDIALQIDNGYETMGGCGDYLFWVGMMQKGKVCFNPKPLNHFRFHSDNTTAVINTTLKGLKESILANQKLHQYGIRRFCRYQSFRLSFLYILEYRSVDKDKAEVKNLKKMISPGQASYAALWIKKLKHKISD